VWISKVTLSQDVHCSSVVHAKHFLLGMAKMGGQGKHIKQVAQMVPPSNQTKAPDLLLYVRDGEIS
jgi:hypothetical protein